MLLCSCLGPFLANVLGHFAEFLKDSSALIFVFSTCPLVSVWYSFLLEFFPDFFSQFPIVSSLSGFFDLGAVSLYTPWAFRSILFFDF